MATTVIVTTLGTTSWTVPAGVYSIKAECLGGAGNGSTIADNYGAGGGGPAYSVTNAIPVTPGSTVYLYVGAAATDSWVNKSASSAPASTADGCLAKGGTSASGATPGSGGSSAACVGDTAYSGGAGAVCGGGGAAGPSGAGKDGGGVGSLGGGGGGGSNGGASSNGAAGGVNDGGAGGNGTGGTGGGVGGTSGSANGGTGSNGGGGGGAYGSLGASGNGGDGGSDTAFDGSHGCGGGGGGAGLNAAPTGASGGSGGLYGGAGGAGWYGGAGGSGRQGLVSLTYTALFTTFTDFPQDGSPSPCPAETFSGFVYAPPAAAAEIYSPFSEWVGQPWSPEPGAPFSDLARLEEERIRHEDFWRAPHPPSYAPSPSDFHFSEIPSAAVFLQYFCNFWESQNFADWRGSSFDEMAVVTPAAAEVDGVRRKRRPLKSKKFDFSIYNHPDDLALIREKAEAEAGLTPDELDDISLEVIDQLLAELGVPVAEEPPSPEIIADFQEVENPEPGNRGTPLGNFGDVEVIDAILSSIHGDDEGSNLDVVSAIGDFIQDVSVENLFKDDFNILGSDDEFPIMQEISDLIFGA